MELIHRPLKQRAKQHILKTLINHIPSRVRGLTSDLTKWQKIQLCSFNVITKLARFNFHDNIRENANEFVPQLYSNTVLTGNNRVLLNTHENKRHTHQ